MQNAKLFIITILATLLLIAGAGWFFSLSTPSTAQGVVEISAADLVPAGAHSRGASESAEFTVVEFSDLQCPACKAVVPYVDALVKQYPDKVRLIYRHYPLISLHPNAYVAAQAAEAAALQDKFWPMHDVLFERQSEWSGLKDPKPFFIDRAKEMGLDPEKFAADLDSQAVKDVVERDLRLAESNKLPGTPSFFLNGTRQNFEDIRRQIQSGE